MLIAWRYKERGTAYQALNPRVRLIVILALTFAIIQVWDLRVLLAFLAFAALQYAVSRLTFAETRTTWTFMAIFVTFIVLLTFLTGRGGLNVFTDQTILWEGRLGPLPVVISSERIAFGLSQAVRLATMALLVVVFPYTIHPARYGVVFRGMGMSDKLSVATDLAFRFVPSLGNDFSTTMDAQKARGYELERAGGVFKALRNLAPLLVPVTIGAIMRGEELVDAMDLRAFGTGPRTWSVVLQMRPIDWAFLVAGVGVLIVITLLNLYAPDFGALWVPPFLYP
jgi:energy-coupling factor transport system permease protein